MCFTTSNDRIRHASILHGLAALSGKLSPLFNSSRLACAQSEIHRVDGDDFTAHIYGTKTGFKFILYVPITVDARVATTVIEQLYNSFVD